MVCILKCFSENTWIIFIKWIEPCCVLYWTIFVLVNLILHFFPPYVRRGKQASCIYSSRMVSPYGIKQPMISTIWIYRNEENILYAHARVATTVKRWLTTSSHSGSTCSANGDSHHSTAFTLFVTPKVKLHCLDAVQIHCKEHKHYIRCQ